MKLKTIEIIICEACLDGVGEECHTSGCALWLHRVDLPISPKVYTVKAEFEVDAGGALSTSDGTIIAEERGT